MPLKIIFFVKLLITWTIYSASEILISILIKPLIIIIEPVTKKKKVHGGENLKWTES